MTSCRRIGRRQAASRRSNPGEVYAHDCGLGRKFASRPCPAMVPERVAASVTGDGDTAIQRCDAAVDPGSVRATPR